MHVVNVCKMHGNVFRGQKMIIKQQNFLLIFDQSLLYTMVNETGLENMFAFLPSVVGALPLHSLSLYRAVALYKINRSRELQNNKEVPL